MQAGRTLINDSFGIALISLFQHLLTAFVCAYALKTIKNWNVPGSVRLFTLIFLAFNPLIVFWLSTALKTMSSAALFMLFAVMYLECILRIKKGEPLLKFLLLTMLVGILTALFRHDYVYVVSISLVLLVIIKQSGKMRIVLPVSGVVCFVVLTLISNSLNAHFGIESKSNNPLLSIPFQQTARFVTEHGDEVKPWEHEAISAVLDYESLKQVYRPERSAAVIWQTRTINEEGLKLYFQAWFSMFQRHPVTYIEATINNSYAYFSPFIVSSVKRIVTYYQPRTNPNFDTRTMLFPESTRYQLYLVTIKVPMKLPGINIFYYLGNYTWFILLLVLGLIIKKKYIFIVGFSPALLAILACIASPVNGYYRYYIPVMMVVPILLAWTVYGVYLYSKHKSDPSGSEVAKTFGQTTDSAE